MTDDLSVCFVASYSVTGTSMLQLLLRPYVLLNKNDRRCPQNNEIAYIFEYYCGKNDPGISHND